MEKLRKHMSRQTESEKEMIKEMRKRDTLSTPESLRTSQSQSIEVEGIKYICSAVNPTACKKKIGEEKQCLGEGFTVKFGRTGVAFHLPW